MDGLEFTDNTYRDLIDAIYDASLAPEKWQHVMDCLSGIAPMAGISLHGMHSGDPNNYLFMQSGYDPGILDEYLNDFAPINPWRTIMPYISSGTVFQPSRSIYAEKYHKTEYFNFLQKCKIDSSSAASIWNDSERTFHITMDVSKVEQEQVADPLEKLLEKITPHISRSLEINHRIFAAQKAGGSMQTMIENMQAPALLLDSNMRVRLTNHAGEKMIENNLVCKLDGNDKLILNDLSATQLLKQTIENISQSKIVHNPIKNISFNAQDPESSGRITAIEVKEDASLSTSSVARFLATPQRLVMLVFAFKSDQNNNISGLLEEKYGLTKSQTKLGLFLCKGGSLEKYADLNRISISTVRNHLQALLEKTDTHRQVELVAKLNTVASRW